MRTGDTAEKGHELAGTFLLQQYLTSGDWDDVEDLPEKLESYKRKAIFHTVC